MKNILFKMLPLLAAVLFATSCSKDDDNGNTVVSDNTNTSVTPASNDASEPVNPSTPSETVQVLYDENGVPYIPFSIMVGREDSESLSKYFASDYEGNGIKQYFDKEDKITITGKSKKIQGELTVDETKYDWPNSWSTSAVFSGKLWGEDIESLVVDDWLIATLNDGKPLSEPQVYDMGDNKLTKAITDCSYLTVEFQYKDYLASTVRLKQNTAFLVFDMEYSAKVIVHCNGKDHTFYLPCSGYLFSGQTRQTVIAVPDDSYVRSCFLKDEHYIDIANDNGKVIHNIKRLQPSDVITRGTFSISEDKWGNTHEVFFSKSNLMVAISSDAVGFYGNPWAIAHKSGDDVGVNHGDNGYADLFGWGTWLNCDDDDMLKTIVGDFEDYYLSYISSEVQNSPLLAFRSSMNSEQTVKTDLSPFASP